MTVGKIYVGLLIAENWKAYKASQSSSFGLKIVSSFFHVYVHVRGVINMDFSYHLTTVRTLHSHIMYP